ncbi:phage baseplate assembly protein V [Kutzneria sp. NPDC052558]|uniref:phage baseplate assembly protein V n=1 Tax=Kutzneria sp. NPDC052558 TaxID=3364121 RepID=UPI0037C834F7
MMPGGLIGQSTAIVWPTIKIGSIVGLPLSPLVQGNLVRAVVDTHLHLPDMFELTFLDEAGTVTDDAGLAIGAGVEILAGDATSTGTTSLIKGEVTAIEAICADSLIYTVIRGYEKAHRLQRARRTRTFLNMKDSDIARQIANHAGLDVGSIDESDTTHTHLAQVAQTDWDFLVARAREIGFETGVVGGEFFFRRASGQPSGGGLLDTLSSLTGIGAGPTLTFKDNLVTFLPRISAANLTPDVEVRVWDAKSARVAVGSASAATGTAQIDGEEPGQLANSFTDGLLPPLPHLPALPPIPGLPHIDFGSSPSNTAFVVVDRPLATGSAADSAAEEAAKGLADHISSTFAEAEGTAVGDPRIQAGVKVTVAHVPKQFAGSWTVTNAKHVFDPAENGYHTRFYVSGRQDRSLLKLASGGAQQHPGLSGLVCGVVTNSNDPDSKGKVKVALPWLSPDYESDWARVVQLGAGRRSGLVFLPEVGDEVLLGFEFGDPRRPYVIGGLVNDNSSYEPLSSAVNGSGSVVKRGITSPAGNGLLLEDDLPPGPPGAAPPTTSSITLGTGDGNMGLAIDQVGGTMVVSCKPAPPASRTPAGTLTIDCSGAGKIEIKAGAGGLKLTSDGQLELSGQAGVKISSPALVEVSGQMIKLN